MIYLQNILKIQPEELVRQVFETHKTNPTQGDFLSLVLENVALAKTPYDKNAITAMRESRYKEYIKRHLKDAALSHLKTRQGTNPKVDKIIHKILNTEPYLTNHNFTNLEVARLVALRSHTLRGVKMNFSSWYKADLNCPFKCLNSQESQDNSLVFSFKQKET